MAYLEGTRAADPESGYSGLPDGRQPQELKTSGRVFKVAVTLLGGSCLALFFIVTDPGSSFRFHGADITEPTSLIGVPYSTRVGGPAAGMPTSAFLPLGRSVGNAYGQGIFHRQDVQLQLPYRSRSGNLVPPVQGFWDNFGRDPGYYEDKTYEQGEQADYKSKSKGGWIPCTVTKVGAEGIQVDVKPGVWIDEKEQKSVMRKKFKRDR